MENNDMHILDKKYKSPIKFMGKPRELAKTKKKISNKIISLVKKNAEISKIKNSDVYDEKMEKWDEEAQKLVKSLITPISDEELEYLDEEDLADILNAIERRKKKARGWTDKELDDLEEVGRQNMMQGAKKLLSAYSGDDDEDFQNQMNSDQDSSTGKQNTTED
jgi:hypothetical protein